MYHHIQLSKLLRYNRKQGMSLLFFSRSHNRRILIQRRHTFECNQTVNCHIINSTLYPIQQLNRWLTRPDSISCLACRSHREEDGGERERRRRGEICPLHSLHPCPHAPLHRPALHPLIKLATQSTSSLTFQTTCRSQSPMTNEVHNPALPQISAEAWLSRL